MRQTFFDESWRDRSIFGYSPPIMETPLTILHVNASSDDNPAVSVALRQAKSLSNRGHRVMWCCRPECWSHAAAARLNLQTFTDLYFESGFPKKNFWRDTRLMARRIDIESLDVLHAHGSIEALIVAFGSQYADRAVATIRTLHDRLPPSTENFSRLLHGTLIDQLVVNSIGLYQELRRLPDFELAFASLIHNGVDLKNYSPIVSGETFRTQSGIDARQPLILMAGRDGPHNGAEIFAEAILSLQQRLPDAIGVIALNEAPPIVAKVQRSLRTRGCTEQALKVVGVQSKMAPVIAAADIVVVPTLQTTGDSGLVLEAMACAKAVVATDLANVRAYIESGVTGLMVRPGDAQALCEGIYAIACDLTRTKEMGLAGRLRAENEFGEDNAARMYEELYGNILELNREAADAAEWD